MFSRSLAPSLIDALAHSPTVALLGLRQAGKTTLALEVAKAAGRPSLYLDPESEQDQKSMFRSILKIVINGFLNIHIRPLSVDDGSH